MRPAIREYEYAVLNLSPMTQRWYKQKLAQFGAWLDKRGIELNELRAQHVRQFMEELRQTPSKSTGRPLSDNTLHGYAQVIKGFLNWAVREEDWGINEKVAKRIEMPKVEQPLIEVFTREQLKRLLIACGSEYNRELTERDRAILHVLLSTGIRASELVGLTLEHTYLTPHDAHLKVKGKGRKEREVPLNEPARAALHRYVTRFRGGRREQQRVFLNRAHQPFTLNGLDQLLYRLRDWAGVTGARCSAHTFRHTFAVEYLRRGGDIYMLSRVLGHSSVKVTEIYLKAVRATEARQGVDVFGDL